MRRFLEQLGFDKDDDWLLILWVGVSLLFLAGAF